MAKQTGIEWCHMAWSPWLGCSKVSQGCQHCYADHLMGNRFGLVEWGPEGTRKRTAPSAWQQVARWDRQAHKTGQRMRLFCGHLCDVFERKLRPAEGEDLPAWRSDLLALIDKCPHLDWLILTKRPGNVLPMIAEATGENPSEWLQARPWVWVGTSIEDQASASVRLPALAAIPAAIRFVSVEPLLKAVTLAPWLAEGDPIHWAIIGGESSQGGKTARACNLAWIRTLLRELEAVGLPAYVKQLGSNAIERGQPYPAGHKGKDLERWPADLVVRQVPLAPALAIFPDMVQAL